MAGSSHAWPPLVDTNADAACVDALPRIGVRCPTGMAAIAALMSAQPNQLDGDRVRRLVDRAPYGEQPDVHVWSEPGLGLAAAWSPTRGPAWSTWGHARVVCDGRIDDRAGLLEALSVAGHAAPAAVTDVSLMARAYTVWGPECFERVSGEFAVCIWDTARHVLLVARDRFGIKPVFYANGAEGVVVSSSLAALRRYGGHSEPFSDESIGDFLLFGFLQNPGATCFAGIARVPPASSVEFERGRTPRVRSYWRPSAGSPLRCRNPRDYAVHFRETLRTCVEDRMERAPVSILMSGGLDSSSVAALATGHGGIKATQCLAVTAVYDTLFPDEERRFSTTAAQALGIAIRHVPVDGHDLFGRWDADAMPPEPSTEVLSAVMRDLLGVAGRHARVALCGDGGDPSLLPGAVVRHLGHFPLGLLAGGLWETFRRGLWPPLGLRSGWLRWRHADRPSMPPWLSPRLRRAYDAQSRWAAFHEGLGPGREPRGEALRVLNSPGWAQSFEMSDPNTTGLGVEIRYPFFDGRMVSLALALPSYPWCVNKTVLREAMYGRLPDAIRLRPKAPLAGDPVTSRAWPADRLVELVRTTPGLDEYIDVRVLQRSVRDEALFSDRQPGTLAAASLASWVRAAVSRPEMR